MKIKTSLTSPVRWMVVDDNKDILTLVTFLLKELGQAEICSFNSPREALDAFCAAPESFQFVLTDLDMPGMNGLDLCRQLLDRSPGLKILLSTGSTNMSEAEARELGFCGLVPKPYPVATLLEAVKAATMNEQSSARRLRRTDSFFQAEPELIAA
jgi:CheY-like chemotaxis protein